MANSYDNYGTFMNMKSLKKEFDIRSTATMMRLVHREQIPYQKISKKIILFPTVAVFAKLASLKHKAGRIYRG